MRSLLLLVMAGTLIVACGDDDNDDRVHEWETTLEGVDDWEDVDGNADVRWTESVRSFTARAEINNDEPGSIRPWHVHFGTCETGGAIVGDDGDYPRLMVGNDGTAYATATVSERLDPEADYHVNVHLSDDELETIIACGDLLRVTDGIDENGVNANDDDDETLDENGDNEVDPSNDVY